MTSFEELLNMGAQKMGIQPLPPSIKPFIQKGWRHVYSELFGSSLVDCLGKHHIEAIEWHWEARIAFLEGRRPDYLAYFPIWSRGNMKSTMAERMVVIDAILSFAYRKPGYAVYISRNKDKVQEHIANIEALLASDGVRKVCPELSNPKRTELTNQQRKWTASFLKTEANYSIQGGTLDSGLAGSRVEDTRPTFLVPDDIDGREDSPVIAENRSRQFTREIIPMRQDNTLVFFAQNLISRFSVMYRIHSGQIRVLTNRKPGEPIPAVYDLVTEQQVVDGIVKDVYVSGTPSWPAWTVQRIQDEIDSEGLESFNVECQHQVAQSKEGMILYNYDDSVHVISESEFASVYGSLDEWLHWRKKAGNDWARTKTDKHANVAAWWAVSSEDTPLPNHKFLMYPMSFPADSAPEDVAERLLSALSPYAYDKVTWAQLRTDILRRANVDVHAKTVAEKISYERQEIGRVMSRYSSALLQRCNVQQGEMSHEQDTVRKIYASIYGLGMRPMNPKKHGGTEAWNREMRVDREVANPFRPDEMGYSQWHLVVPDDKNAPYREVDGKTIYRPKPYPLDLSTKDMWDDDLCRFQLANVRYRPPILTATGEEIDVPEKLYDDFFNCFVAGTQIETAQGKKSIEHIQCGDMVWTRHGLRPVVRTLTKSDVEVWQVDFSNGTSLIATPDHPIYVNDATFIPLQMLQVGDKVDVWQITQQNLSLNALSLTASRFIDTLKQSKVRTVNTLRLTLQTVKKALAITTLNYGNLSMEMCPKVTKFTTKMAMPSTMTFPTWKPFSPQNIGQNTPKHAVQHLKDKQDLPMPEHSIHMNGIEVLKDENFLLRENSLIHHWIRYVNTVMSHTLRIWQKVGGAVIVADKEIVQEPRPSLLLRTFLKRVKNVIQSFWQGQPIKNSAPKVVVSKIHALAKRQNVYNLSVADVPEYYANGILVHNCGQMAYVGNDLQGTSLTTDQRVQLLVPQEAKTAVATATTAMEKFGASINMEFQTEIAKMTLGVEADDELDWE